MIFLVGTAVTVTPVEAQNGRSNLQGPPLVQFNNQPGNATGNSDVLQREQFRRQAAEEARKQLEELAGQLRDQLGEEVARRRTSEARVLELTARLTLTDQLDQERQKFRQDRLESLETSRRSLEQELAVLNQRLTAETARRKALEAVVATHRATVAAPDERDALQARIGELEKKLNATEWARKLAEAQLKLLSGGQAN